MNKKNQLRIIQFIIYTAFVVWMTLLMREPRNTGRVFEPRLFWAFRAWNAGEYYGKVEAIQYIQNILFFIPFGVLFPFKKWNYVLFASIFTAAVIECFQYIFNFGWCEIDDVISNTSGALIGFCMWIAVEMINRKNRGKNCVD